MIGCNRLQISCADWIYVGAVFQPIKIMDVQQKSRMAMLQLYRLIPN
jgi:hypothetical protein